MKALRFSVPDIKLPWQDPLYLTHSLLFLILQNPFHLANLFHLRLSKQSTTQLQFVISWRNVKSGWGCFCISQVHATPYSKSCIKKSSVIKDFDSASNNHPRFHANSITCKLLRARKAIFMRHSFRPSFPSSFLAKRPIVPHTRSAMGNQNIKGGSGDKWAKSFRQFAYFQVPIGVRPISEVARLIKFQAYDNDEKLDRYGNISSSISFPIKWIIDMVRAHPCENLPIQSHSHARDRIPVPNHSIHA